LTYRRILLTAVGSGGSFGLRRACLDSIFEISHLRRVLATGFVRRDLATFSAPSRASPCGGCIIGYSAAICAKACEDALGLTITAEIRAGARTGQDRRHVLAGLFWQSLFGRLAGHGDVNGAERLRHDAAMR